MTTKIDTLRQKVAAIGKTQIEYYDFFPSFADQLIKDLGQYLGDKNCVALCPAEGDFSFNIQYRYEGLGFESGRYRIPIMVRLKNLEDEGDLLIRIKLTFVKGESAILAWVGEEKPLTIDSARTNELCQTVYHHLSDLLSSTAWFEENPGDYQGTRIGFSTSKSAA